MSDDDARWAIPPPLSPTEHIRYFGLGGESPSEILCGPSYDVGEHYERVRALHAAYPYIDEDKCEEHTEALLRSICGRVQLPSLDVLTEIHCAITTIFKSEELYQPTLLPCLESPPTPTWIETVERPYLRRKEQFFALAADRIRVASKMLVEFYVDLLKNFAPEPAFSETANTEQVLSIPFIGLIKKSTSSLVQSATECFASASVPGTNDRLFPQLHSALFDNMWSASGYTENDYERVKNPKLVFPVDSKLPPQMLACTYLKNTPLLDLFMMPLPFDIPMRTRFEHHWIVAPPGAGKSTTLQYLIMRDLELVAANQASIVVMESNRDLIKAIEGLKVFAPGQPLAGKLVTIDAEDVEWPIALNLFDVGLEQTKSYSAAEQEAFRNSVLSLYEYIFSALLSAEMTSRQHTLFQATIELILAIPSATLDTLIDLMQPGGIKKYQHIVSTLDPDIQRFFELKFNTSEAAKTKEQVVDRLFAVKRIRTLSRMFSAPKSKFDFFTEMGSAKVILINVPKSLLQEDGVEIVGRFFISMILLAAHKRQLLPKEQRLPCFVYIDECQDFIKRDPKIPAILDQARKLNVGLVLAHQRLQQLHASVLDALYGATAIKFASKISDAAAHALARDMRTTPEFILEQPLYHFAAYVRGLTNSAVSISIPDTDMNKMPRMTQAEQAMVSQGIRERYAISRDMLRPAAASSGSATAPNAAPGPSANRPTPHETNDDWRS